MSFNRWRSLVDGTEIDVGSAIPDSVVYQFNAQDLAGTSVGDTINTMPNQASGQPDADGGNAVLVDSGINGYQSLEFPSSSNSYTISSTDFNDISQAVTVFAVVDFTQSSSTKQVALLGDPRLSLAPSGVGTPGWRYYAGSSFIGGTEDDAVWLLTAVFDGPSSLLREDQTETASGDAGASSATEFNSGGSAEDGDQVGFVEIHDGLPSNGLETREQEVYDMWTASGTDAGTVYYQETYSGTAIYDMASVGNYVIAGGAGVSIYDVSDPESPVEVGTISENDVAVYGAVAQGDYYYVADQSAEEFRVYDISDKTNPTLVQSIAVNDLARKVTLDGNYAYMTTNSANELWSFDISDPPNATTADTLTDADLDYSFETAVVDSTLLVCARGTNNIVQVDISDPTALSKIGTYTDSEMTGPYGIDVSGDTAFVTDGDSDVLFALDVTDPTAINKLDSLGSTGIYHPYGVDAYNTGDNAAVASRGEVGDSNKYITTVDTSDPSNMAEVARIPTDDADYGPYGTLVMGEYTYSGTRTNASYIVSGTE